MTPPTFSPETVVPRPIILPPELPPVRFRLGPASVGVLALCLTMHLAAGLPNWLRTPTLAAQDIGVFMFGFLLSLCLSILGWKLDRSKRAGEWVFCFLMLLFATSRMLENVNAHLKTRIHEQAVQASQRAALRR